jgi:radical SAM protein with 4Fe4S-binding SPASM domain
VLADKIMDSYDAICNVFDGNVTYQISTPFCLFKKGFIENLVEKDQIISGCHVMDRSGVIFDTEGNTLLCNCLHHIPIGKYLEDFEDNKSFKDWWSRSDVKACNRELLRTPSTKCNGCKDYDNCCGGCPLQWFSFDPNKVIGT